MTGRSLKTVVNIVQEESREETLEHLKDLDRINDQLTEQERARRGLLTAVEHERTTFAQASSHLEELNEAKATLGTQADQARTGLDIQDMVSDERRIRANVVNPDTYLGARDQETVREMLRTFMEEVVVDANTATIRYTIPFPHPGDAYRSYTHELDLA